MAGTLALIIFLALDLDNKNKLYENSDLWSRNMLSFDSLKNGLELVAPPHFVDDFSENIFHVTFY